MFQVNSPSVSKTLPPYDAGSARPPRSGRLASGSEVDQLQPFGLWNVPTHDEPGRRVAVAPSAGGSLQATHRPRRKLPPVREPGNQVLIRDLHDDVGTETFAELPPLVGVRPSSEPYDAVRNGVTRLGRPGCSNPAVRLYPL